VEEVKPFGLAGSAGSTSLRITLKGDPPRQLFGKLYARSHLRSDRWYKLGRELLRDAHQGRQPGLHRSGTAVAAGPVGAVSVTGAMPSFPAGRLVSGAGNGQQRPLGGPLEPRPRGHRRAGCPPDGCL
jgi:hypothetical protein